MRLHVVDGTWELFRAHYSKRPSHKTPDGRDGKATVGVVSSMLRLLDDANEAVTHIAVAFDHPIESFRNDLYAGYKTGDGVDPALSAQFGAVEDAVRALGIVVWPMDRWETDDALATAAARFADQVDQVRICSPDKDLGQCIRGQKVVTLDRLREVETDEAGFLARWGIKPRQMPDLLGLVGDTADGIPGVDGFGEKTAATLIATFGSIEAIPDDPAAWPKGVRRADFLAGNLAGSRPAAALWKRLATLVEDVPLAEDLDGLRFRGVPRDRFAAWCRSFGAERMLDRPTRWA